LFLKTEQDGSTIASGIPLQICDVFLPELNKAGAEMSLDTLASLLQPFLHSLG
jgi:hypothetical protein